MIDTKIVSEQQESIARQQAIIMLTRNYSKPHIIKRVFKRFLKCINN